MTKALGSVAVRLALAYALVFGPGGWVLWSALTIAVTRYAAEGLTTDLQTETRVLLAENGGSDQAMLVRKVEARSRVGGLFVYSVNDAQGRRLAGQLPEGLAPRQGLDEIQLPYVEEEGGPAEEVPVRTLTTNLPQGTLVVGKSTYAVHELEELLQDLGLWAVLGLTGVAALSGAAAGGLLAARLSRINRAAARIMEGHPDERVPSVGLGTELESVRGNLNALLDWQQRALEALRHVSTDIAHDLRTPLNRLRQRLDRTQSESVDGRVPESAVHAAIADLDQVLATFSALLRIGQLEGGAGRALFRPVKLGEVVDRVFEAYQPAGEESGHTLTRHVDSDAEVVGDPELLVQLLSNLIDNALVHAGEGAHIRIEVQDEGAVTVLAVRDDGRGVPQDQIGRITRRFYRLDSSRNTPGQGLGLALVAAIAALHEADLSIEPNDPGLAVRIAFNQHRMDRNSPP